MKGVIALMGGVCAIATSAPVEAQGRVETFNLAAGNLDEILTAYAQRTGAQLIFRADDLKGVVSPGVVGSMSPERALEALLRGTQFTYVRDRSGAIAITRVRAHKTSAIVDSAPLLSDVAPSQSAGDLTVKDIIVTAQRREQNLLRTPISISALSSSALDKRGFSNITDIGSSVPNVLFKQGTGTSNQIISIRGSAQANDALFYDQPVGVYVDGIYIAKSEGGLFDIDDISRIEVLRGPQGTLYGRNTLSGAVNIIEQKPDGKPGAILSTGVGNYARRMVRATVSSPWIGNLAFRGSISFREHDGFIKNKPDSRYLPDASPPRTNELDALNSLAGRLAARWKPEDNFTVDYTFDYSRQRNRQNYATLDHFSHVDGVSRPTCVAGAPADPRYSCPEGTGGVPGLKDIFDPASPSYIGVDLTPYLNSGRASTAEVDQPQYDNSRVIGNALIASLKLGPVELKSLTAYRTLRTSRDTDFDASPVDLIHASLEERFHSFSQELQANASFSNINIVSGLYYYSDFGTEKNLQKVLSPSLYNTGDHSGTKAEAIYAQADWTPPILNGNLTLTVGGRYTSEDKRGERFFAIDTPGTDPFILIPDVHAKASFHRFTPTATIAYKLSSDVNAYARYASGFKSGGFNGQASTIVSSTTPFAAERVNSYEVGLKARMFGGLAQLTTAVFYEKHKDQQIDVSDNSSGSFAGVIRNGAEATVKGVEAELNISPTRYLHFGGSFGYLDSKFDRYITPAGDEANDRVFPLAPKYSISANADATVIDKPWGSVLLHLDYSYLSKQYAAPYRRHPNFLSTDPNELENANDAVFPSYGLLNGRIVIDNMNVGPSKIQFSIFAKNITNEQYRIGCIPFGASLGGATLYYYGDPRTYGLDVTARF